MQPLAEVPQLIERLGRDLTATELVRSAALLRDASAAVRAAAWGQTINRDTSTVFLTVGCDGVAMLPQWPVVDVLTVSTVYGTPAQFAWYAGSRVYVGPNALLNAWEVEPLGSGPAGSVSIEYVHGYAPTPDDITGLVCQIAARALGALPDESGIVQEALGGYSYTTGSAAAAGGLGLLPAELDIAKRYRRNAVPIPTLWAR